MAKSPQRRAPMWARLAAVAGCVLMVASGGVLVTGQALLARYANAVEDGNLVGDPAGGARRPSGIEGPLTILLAGIDPRDSRTAPLADSILVAHVNRTLDQAYIFSVPRDLIVDIPAFEPAGYPGGRGKVNGAMSRGSAVGDGRHDVKQGFQLLARTVADLLGIDRFDTGAIINFGGFQKIVEAMGGVTMYVDQNVRSEHLKPDGTPRDRLARCADHTCEHPYVGPQKEYRVGTHHLQAWEALDYVRQRYGLPRVDYDRQRHQQQFLKAMAEQALSRDVVTNPTKLLRVVDAAGKSLIFDRQGHNIVDWGLALSGIRAQNITLIRLPGRSIEGSRGGYAGEALVQPDADRFFQAVREDRVDEFLFGHPQFLNQDA